MIARVLALLLSKNLSVKDRTLLVDALINRVGIPLRAIIAADENRRILVQGEPLSIEQTQLIQESATALKSNPALRLIRDQVRFMAIDKGYLQSDDLQIQLAYKMALWYAQEEKNLIDALAS